MDFFENINIPKIVEHISTSKTKEIKKYIFLIQNLQTVNLESNRAYQKTFNGFYRVRRDTAWQQIYYAMFEEEKKRVPSFERIICEIWKRTGRIEPSFSSKMVATINPNMPVWDKYVLQNLHYKLEGTGELRLKNAIALYDKMIKFYINLLQTDEALRAIKIFDQALNDYAWITPTKKIDLILWQARDN